MWTSEFDTWLAALHIEGCFLICASQFERNTIRGYLAICLQLPSLSWSACCFQLGLGSPGLFSFLSSYSTGSQLKVDDKALFSVSSQEKPDRLERLYQQF